MIFKNYYFIGVFLQTKWFYFEILYSAVDTVMGWLSVFGSVNTKVFLFLFVIVLTMLI